MSEEMDRLRSLARSLEPEEWFTFDSPLGLVAVRTARRRIGPDELGMREIRALVLVSEHIDSALMKKLSVRLLGAGVNLPEVKSLPPEEAQSFAQAASDLFLGHVDRRVAAAQREPSEPAEPRPPLTRPDGTDPEGFYRQVAEAYREVSAKTRAVAPVLAEEAGVPVATVHRWVLEARRRGFLPPSRRGKST